MRATPGAYQLARKACRRCRPQHYDVAPSLPAAGIQARPAPPASRPLHTMVLAPLLAAPLVEEAQRAQSGARVRDGTIGSSEAQNLSICPPRPGENDEEGGDRHYARSLLCDPPDPARPARPARVARESHCLLISNSLVARRTMLPTSPHSTPLAVAQFCSVQKSGRGGYSRRASRLIYKNC